jgi:L-amino acid N-acyltransferase YncA
MTRHAYPIGAFHIDPIPSQPQVAHCHGFFVPVDMRGKGHGYELKLKQMDELRAAHYDYATATVDGQNGAQIEILKQAGWAHLASFKNSKTGGTTELWGYAIANKE